jgi:hypothetical protein
LTSELIGIGIEVGIFTNAALSGCFANESNYITPSCTRNHISKILDLMARITYSTQQAFEEILSHIVQHPDRNSHYIIVTPIITREAAELINILSKHQCRITIISLNHENIELIKDSIKKFTVREDMIEFEAV